MENKKVELLFVILLIFCFNSVHSHSKKLFFDVNGNCEMPIDTIKNGYFYVSYDTMELQINRAIRESGKFSKKVNMKNIATGVILKVKRNGKIKKVIWKDNPKPETELEQIHQNIITRYLMSLGKTRNCYVDNKGKKIILKEIILLFMVDDCGYIKLGYSNSFKDESIYLPDCPFAI
jgi:hypothetical protein